MGEAVRGAERGGLEVAMLCTSVVYRPRTTHTVVQVASIGSEANGVTCDV